MAIIKKFRIKSFKKSDPLLSFNKISISFGKRQILDNVTFKIEPGQIIGLLGPNGAGKSTIFNIITGLIKPDHGNIFFGKIDATEYPIYLRTRKFRLGLIPQHGGAFRDLTLKENLDAIAEILVENKNDRISKVNELITKFELDNVKHVKVRNLSGGQVKKTTICMALIGEPQILLADEVFANLDVLSIQMLKEIFVKLQSENPKMCIIITEHQALELLRICDTAMILSNTKIIAHGTPSQLLNNQNARNAYFGDSFKFS